MFANYGSIHFRREIQQAVSHPLATIKKVTFGPIGLLKPKTIIAQVKRTGTTVLNPLVALKKTAQAMKQVQKTVLNPLVSLKKTQAEVKRSPMLQTILSGGLNKGIAEAKRSPIAAALLTGGVSLALAKKKAKSQDTSQGATQDVYQDANGNRITKAEYDRLMAQSQQTSEDIYQDENGNRITKEEYLRRSIYPTTIENKPQEDVYQDENGNIITKADYDRLATQQIGPQALISSNIPQDYQTQSTDITGGQSSYIDSGQAQNQFMYQDQYGRATNKEGYPIDAQGNILALNQMPEYKNTVIDEMNRIKSRA